MAEPIVIGDTIKALPGTANAKMISLTQASIAASTLSMHDMSTSADYQVPVGKKLIIIEITLLASVHNAANTCTMYHGTTVDSTVGATIFFQTILRTSSGTNEPTWKTKCYAEIAAGNYITVTQLQNGANVVRGIEIDA